MESREGRKFVVGMYMWVKYLFLEAERRGTDGHTNRRTNLFRKEGRKKERKEGRKTDKQVDG